MADNKEPSQRQLRVGQEMKKLIAMRIERGEIRNLHAIDALVTITEARVSPDLKYCIVYFVTSNKELDDEALKALQLAASHFRKVISSQTSLRYVPEIVFKIDESFQQADHIEKLLRDPKVLKDLQNEG